MSHFMNFTDKQKQAERNMQKLLFGKPLSNIKKCTKKSQKLEKKLLSVVYSM
jgi:hypothetical protein